MNRSMLFATCSTLCAGALLASIAHAEAQRPSDRASSPTPTALQPARDAAQRDDDGGIAGGTSNGPDVIVSTIGSALSEYGVVNGVGGWAMTTVACNIGEADAIWIDDTNLSNPLRNQHPVIGQNMYRLKDGRFEHIGMSWLKHGFCAADAPSCGSPYEPNSSCDWLGTHATDTYSASLNAAQASLGPRSEINPWTGAFPYPYVKNWNATGNAIYKRLQIDQADLNPAQNAGALYFAEVQYICTDEQPINRSNNVSYRQVSVGSTNASGQYDLSFTSTTNQQQPAINAWRALDPAVVLNTIDVPGDGRMILGYKVTDLGGGQWRYEYALYNMNSDRAARAISLPVPDSINVSNIGFHDVPYHSGEDYVGTDWTSARAAGVMSWSTDTITANPNANAVRWGSLYNFRFECNAPPKCAAASIALFKSGTPAAVDVSVLAPTTCPADFAPNGVGNGAVDVDDLIGVILAWGPCASISNCACPADVAPAGGNDVVDVDDLIAVIMNWGTCP